MLYDEVSSLNGCGVGAFLKGFKFKNAVPAK